MGNNNIHAALTLYDRLGKGLTNWMNFSRMGSITIMQGLNTLRSRCGHYIRFFLLREPKIIEIAICEGGGGGAYTEHKITVGVPLAEQTYLHSHLTVHFFHMYSSNLLPTDKCKLSEHRLIMTDQV